MNYYQQMEFGKNSANSAASPKQPALSDYLNYRDYLADFYKFKQEITKFDRRPYGYNTFAAAADIKSPNYLKMIIEGKRNLSEEMVEKFSKALGLNKESTDEFKILVKHTQTTDPAERNLYLKQLIELRIANQLRDGSIDKKAWDKIPNWVVWVIYALVDQKGVSFTTEGLKETLRGKASTNEIEQALNTLFNTGELKVDEQTGQVIKTRQMIESGEEIPTALVKKLQAQLMYLGLESLYQDSPQDRELGSLTLSLTRTEFEELRFKLRQMRKSINKDNSIARLASKGERVYQLNIQLFPLTEKTEQGKNQQASPTNEQHFDANFRQRDSLL